MKLRVRKYSKGVQGHGPPNKRLWCVLGTVSVIFLNKISLELHDCTSHSNFSTFSDSLPLKSMSPKEN